MKKHYITPAVKSVNVVGNEYMMIGGSLGNDTTGTMDANVRRGRRGIWGNLWDDSAECDVNTEE